MLEILRAYDREIVILEDDPAIVHALVSEGVTVLRDAADPDILREFNADQALAQHHLHDAPPQRPRRIPTSRGLAVCVRVFSESDAGRIREPGALAIVEAKPAADALLSWHAVQRSSPASVEE